MAILEFCGLLAVIVVAAYMLSHGAERMAEKWGRNIVGSIVLALVTTLPEYAFVFWAAMKHQYAMAIGSAVGACVLLITLGYGLVIVLATSRLGKNKVDHVQLSKATRIDAAYLLITGAVAFVFVWSNDRLSVFEGIILALLLGGYMFQVIRGSKKHHQQTKHVSRRQMAIAWAEIVFAGAIVFVSSEPFVDSMIHIAEMFSISPVVIAVILGPIASEMPEKLAAYITVLRDSNAAELSVCNFLGSKVNHNSLLLGIIPFVACANTGQCAVPGLLSTTFVLMTVFTVGVSALLINGRLHKWQGYMLIGCYVAAMVFAVKTH